MVKLLRYNRRVQLGVVLLIAAVLISSLAIVQRMHPCAPPRGKGDKIALDNHQDLYVMDADGSHLCRLTFDGANNTNPTWSPNGQQIAFFSSRDRINGIYVMQADGSNERLLRATNHYAGGLAWSPDGKYLAFVPYDATSYLAVITVDGSNVQRVTDSAVGVGSWSPDGRSIAIVTSSGSLNSQVSIVQADGSNLRIVADERIAGYGQYNNPAWSPDGQRIALDNLQKICLVNADGSNGHCLNVNPTNGNNQYPTWSPDSQRIAFVSYHLGDKDGIYVMNADGSNVRRLNKNNSLDLAWSP